MWYKVAQECKLGSSEFTQPAIGYQTLCGNQNRCNAALKDWHGLVAERCGEQEIVPVSNMPPQMRARMVARQEGPTIAGVVRPPPGYNMESVTLTATHIYEMVSFSLDAACIQDARKQPCLGLLNSEISKGAFNGITPSLDSSSIAEAAMYIAQDPKFLCNECTTGLMNILVEHKQSSLFDSLGMSIKVDQVSARIQVRFQAAKRLTHTAMHPWLSSYQTCKTR